MDAFHSPTSVTAHRPAVPPKPKSDPPISPSLAGEKQTTGTQVNLMRTHSAGEKRTTTQHRNGELSHQRKSLIEDNNSRTQSPPPLPRERQDSPRSPQTPSTPPSPSVKPALPPKPVGSGLLSPRKIVSVITPSQVKPKPKILSAVNPIVRGFNTNTTTTNNNNGAILSSSQQQQQLFLNRLHNNNKAYGTGAPTPPARRVDELDTLNSNNSAFLIANKNSTTSSTPDNNSKKIILPHSATSPSFLHHSEPVSPNRPNPRNSLHFFHFPSFGSSSTSKPAPTTGVGGGVIRKIGEIKAKSASLGRNMNAPGQNAPFNKSITLQRVSPLDLCQPQQRYISNALSDLNSPIRNFGRSISFAPESHLPPPPPPRARKKPLSPIPQGATAPPVWPPPPVPPPSSIPTPPAAPTVSPQPAPASSIIKEESSTTPPPPPETADLTVPPIQAATYATVDIEMKWAMRKLKLEQKQQKPESTIRAGTDPNGNKCVVRDELIESDSDRYATIAETLPSSANSQAEENRKLNRSLNGSIINKDSSQDSHNDNNIMNSIMLDKDEPVDSEEKTESWLSKYLPDPVCSINRDNSYIFSAAVAANSTDNNIRKDTANNNKNSMLAADHLVGQEEDDNDNEDIHYENHTTTFKLATKSKAVENLAGNEILANKSEKIDKDADDEDDQLGENKSFLFCHTVRIDSDTNSQITFSTTKQSASEEIDLSKADKNESGKVKLEKDIFEGLEQDVKYLSVCAPEDEQKNQSIEQDEKNNKESIEERGSFLYSSGKGLIHLAGEKLEESNESTTDDKEKISARNDPEKLLHLVDEKIQSAVSLLSNLSGRTTPQASVEENNSSFLASYTQKELLAIHSTENICQQDNLDPLDNKDAELVSEIIKQRFLSPARGIEGTIPPAPRSPADFNKEKEEESITVNEKENTLTKSDSFRRRSWNCEDAGSPSPSDSSSAGSVHRGRAATTSNCTPRTAKSWVWVDEGEISTGALGDGESSDAIGRNSLEDIGSGRGSISKRKRFVNSLFGSFGKAGSTSGSSIRSNSCAAAKKHKQIRSQFFVENSEGGGGSPRQGPRAHRQLSEIVMAPTKVGLTPPPASASVMQGISSPFQNFEKPHVQFSPEIVSTPKMIHSPHMSTYSCPSVTDTDDTKSTKSDHRLSMTFSEEGSTISTLDPDKRDSESCSSSESGGSSTGSSSSYYNDIINELSEEGKKVFYVAREIMTSERTFVDVLNLLTVDFVNFVKKAESLNRQPIISQSEFDGILGGLPNLKQLNEDLLKDLEERIAHWRERPRISDIIVKKGPFLKNYSVYLRDFEKTMQNVDICCQKYPLFAATVREFETSDRCKKLNLKHFMLKPVQRMPQYRLLLEDYAKTLSRDNDDYEDTLKAITIVRGVAEHADEAIRLQVSAEKLMHLQNRLPNVIILKTNRQLLKEGELLKVCRKQLQPRFFALMNDCLLCMMYNPSAGAKDLKLRYELPLAGMRVSLTVTEDYPFEFSVISVARSFNLVAKSAKERDDWMKALNTAIHNNIKVRTCTTPDQEKGFQIGKEAPVWIQDSRVTMCQVCTGEFTITFRRHHCRACGKVVCSNCSGSQAPLPYKNYKADRVCDECYQYLLEEFDQENRNNSTDTIEILRGRFKKVTPNVSTRAGKHKRSIPQRLEVQANNTGSRMSGYLNWKRERKSWKRHWFVLMDRVLYLYAASEDIVAIRSIPILGWIVHTETAENIEGVDGQLIFKLTHIGQDPIVFHAENSSLAEKWVVAMNEATVLT